MSEESDLFMDKSRLEKMIELGIYDNKMVDKMRTFGNNTNVVMNCNKSNDNSKTTQRPIEKTVEKAIRETYRPPNSGHGFKPIENSSFKWSEPIARKRQRTPSPVRRDRIRDEIQTKISRNEMERKLTVDYFKTKNPNNDSDNRIETNSGNSKSNDTDFRHKSDTDSRHKSDNDSRRKSDTDSRLRDTDNRQNESINRKNDDNLPFITPAAVDQDFRSSRIDENDEKNVAIREKLIDNFQKRVTFISKNKQTFNTKRNDFFDINRRSKPKENSDTIEDIDAFIRNCGPKSVEPKHNFDDIDSFIKQCEMKLGSKAANRGRSANRGNATTLREKTNDRRPLLNQRQDNESFTRSNTNQNRFESRSDINTNKEELYNRRPQEDRINREEITTISEPEQNPTKHMEILRETVEELAKSNLYCQYCDCYLSSLVEVNTHIATLIHQQNMAKKIMEENNVKIESDSDFNDKQNEMNDSERIHSIPEPIVEKPVSLTGMNLLIKLIEDRKQITLKTLTEMESYEINNDKEASLAKELAKLLTNELLNYKMNLMPDNVKEALKHQGIGLINNDSNN